MTELTLKDLDGIKCFSLSHLVNNPILHGVRATIAI